MIITTNRTFLGNLVSPILLISMFLTARSVPITLNEASDIVYGAVCDSYSYFEVEMPDPCQDLNITVIPLSGNPDIYVSRTRTEPTKRMLTWASVDDSSLMISHWDPESAPGTYYVGVYNDCMDQSDPATFKIQAFEANSTEDDIYLNPSLTFNKLVAAEDYEYFRFCVPKCADVTVTLENCLDSSICPTTYSYPELIVSRTEVDPTINDYAYLLATTTRRYITVNHTDPAGRDANGYQTGSYYVGVYGWCTPDEYVTNWEFDGPCSYANNSLFNVTVELNFCRGAE